MKSDVNNISLNNNEVNLDNEELATIDEIVFEDVCEFDATALKNMQED